MCFWDIGNWAIRGGLHWVAVFIMDIISSTFGGMCCMHLFPAGEQGLFMVAFMGLIGNEDTF